MWELVLELLKSIGITQDKIAYFIISIIILIFVWVRTNPIEKIKYNIGVIASHLTTKTRFDSKLLQDYSPRTLTEIGLKILQDSGFVGVFENNFNTFIERMSKLSESGLKTKLDVEQAAIKAVASLLNESIMNPVKPYLYNHPDVPLDLFSTLAGIYIRDWFLKQHPEITE